MSWLADLGFGVREGVILLIVSLAVYMGFLYWRMRRLGGEEQPLFDFSSKEPVDREEIPVPTLHQTPSDAELLAAIAAGRLQGVSPLAEAAVRQDPSPAERSPIKRGRIEVRGEEPESEHLTLLVQQLQEEVATLRGELASVRAEVQEELSTVRAVQSVSPLYGDAMQMALGGCDVSMIAERCGIPRGEAELVVALANSQRVK